MTDALRFTVRVVLDAHAESPRTAQDNMGRIRAWHPRYRIGDADADCPDDPGEFGAWARAEGAVWLPLYLYDHGGLSVSTAPFGDAWDSGQVGFAYATPTRVREWLGEDPADNNRDRVLEVLRAEVAELDQFLRGECYGFVVEDADGEVVESCGGFLGEEAAREAAAEAVGGVLRR